MIGAGGGGGGGGGVVGEGAFVFESSNAAEIKEKINN